MLPDPSRVAVVGLMGGATVERRLLAPDIDAVVADNGCDAGVQFRALTHPA